MSCLARRRKLIFTTPYRIIKVAKKVKQSANAFQLASGWRTTDGQEFEAQNYAEMHQRSLTGNALGVVEFGKAAMKAQDLGELDGEPGGELGGASAGEDEEED